MPPFSPPPPSSSFSSSFSSVSKSAVSSSAQAPPRDGPDAFHGDSSGLREREMSAPLGSSPPCSSVSSAARTPQADVAGFPSFLSSVASTSQTLSLSVASTSSGPSPPPSHLLNAAHLPHWSLATSPAPCSPQAFPSSPDALIGACIPLPPAATAGKVSRANGSLPPFCVVVAAVSPIIHTSSGLDGSSVSALCSAPRLDAGGGAPDASSASSSFEAAQPTGAAAVSSLEGSLSREQVATCLSLSSSFVYAAAFHSCSQLRCLSDCVYSALSNEVYLIHVPALLFAQKLSRPFADCAGHVGGTDGLDRPVATALGAQGAACVWPSQVYVHPRRRYKTVACADGGGGLGPWGRRPYGLRGEDEGSPDARRLAVARRRTVLTQISCQSLWRPAATADGSSGESVASSCPVSRAGTLSGEDLLRGDRRRQPSRPLSWEGLPLHALSGVETAGVDRCVLGGFPLSPAVSASSQPPSVLLSLLSRVLPAPFPSLWPPLVLLQNLEKEDPLGDERGDTIERRETSDAPSAHLAFSSSRSSRPPMSPSLSASSPSPSAASHVMVLGHAYAMSVCTHMGATRSVQIHPPTACTALLLFSDVEGWGVHVWREREPCSGVLELAIRVEVPAPLSSLDGDERGGRRETKRHWSDLSRGSIEADVQGAERESVKKEEKAEAQGDWSWRPATPHGLVKVAVLELDDRMQGIGGSGLSSLDFGLADSSPFAAVPRQHILFFYLASEPRVENDLSTFFPTQKLPVPRTKPPRSSRDGENKDAFVSGERESRRRPAGEETAREKSEMRKRPREKSERRQFAFLGAFMVDGLARGAVGRPVVQRVAGPAQVPLHATGVDVAEIEKVEPCEISMMTSFLTVSSSSAVPPVPSGVVLGAPVAGGLPLCGASAALPPLVGARQQQQIWSTQRRSGVSSVSAMAGNLVWGELTGLLASAIPSCRLTLRTGANDQVELLLSPLVLCCPEPPAPSKTNPEPGAGEAEGGRGGEAVMGPCLRYALRCLSSVSRRFLPVAAPASLEALWLRRRSLLRPLAGLAPAPSALWLLPLQQTLRGKDAGYSPPSLTTLCKQVAPQRTLDSSGGGWEGDEEPSLRLQQNEGAHASTFTSSEGADINASLAVSPRPSPAPGGDSAEETAMKSSFSRSASRASACAGSPSLMSLAVLPEFNVAAGIVGTDEAGEPSGPVYLWHYSDMLAGRPPVCCLQSRLSGDGRVRSKPGHSLRGEGRRRAEASRRERLLPPMQQVSWVPASSLALFQRACAGARVDVQSAGGPALEETPEGPLRLPGDAGERSKDTEEALARPDMVSGHLPVLLCVAAEAIREGECMRTKTRRRPLVYAFEVDLLHALFGIRQVSLAVAPSMSPLVPSLSPFEAPVSARSPCRPAAGRRDPFCSFARVVASQVVELPVTFVARTVQSRLLLLLLVETVESLRPHASSLEKEVEPADLDPLARGSTQPRPSSSLSYSLLLFGLGPHLCLINPKATIARGEHKREEALSRSAPEDIFPSQPGSSPASVDSFVRRQAGVLGSELLGVWPALSPLEAHATWGEAGEPLLDACVVSSSALLLASPLFFHEPAGVFLPSVNSSPVRGISRLRHQLPSQSVSGAANPALFSGGGVCFLFLLRLVAPVPSSGAEALPAVPSNGDSEALRGFGRDLGPCSLSQLSLFAVASVPQRRRVTALALAPDTLAVGTGPAPSRPFRREREAAVGGVEPEAPLAFVYSLRGLPLVVPCASEAGVRTAALSFLSSLAVSSGRPQAPVAEPQSSPSNAPEHSVLSDLAQSFACAQASGVGAASLAPTRRDAPSPVSPAAGSSPVETCALGLERVLAAVAAAPHLKPETALPLVRLGGAPLGQLASGAATGGPRQASASRCSGPKPACHRAPPRIDGKSREAPNPSASFTSAYGRLRTWRRGQGTLAVPPAETGDNRGPNEGHRARDRAETAVSVAGPGLEPSSGDMSSAGSGQADFASHRVCRMGLCRLPGATTGLLVKTVRCRPARGDRVMSPDDACSCVYLFVSVPAQAGQSRFGSRFRLPAAQSAPHIWLRLLPLPPENCLPTPQLQAFYRHPLVAGLRDAWWGPEASATLFAFLALPPATCLGGFATSHLGDETGNTSEASGATTPLPHHTSGAPSPLVLSRQASTEALLSPGLFSGLPDELRARPDSTQALLASPVPGLVQRFSLHTLLPLLLPVAAFPWAPLTGAPAGPRGPEEPHRSRLSPGVSERPSVQVNPTNAAAATVASVASASESHTTLALCQQREQWEIERRMLQVVAAPLLLPYHPSVLGALFSSGFVGSVKWILGTLLRCLRAAGLARGDKTDSSGVRVRGLETSASLETTRLLGGFIEPKESRVSEAESEGLWDAAAPDETDAGDPRVGALSKELGGADAVCGCPNRGSWNSGNAKSANDLCGCCCVLESLLQTSMMCLSGVFLQLAAEEQDRVAARAARGLQSNAKGPSKDSRSSRRDGAAWEGPGASLASSSEAAVGSGDLRGTQVPAQRRQGLFETLLTRCGVAGRGETAGPIASDGRELSCPRADSEHLGVSSERDDLFAGLASGARAFETPRPKVGERAADLFAASPGLDEDPFDVSDILGLRKKGVDVFGANALGTSTRCDQPTQSQAPPCPSSSLSCLSASSPASLDPVTVGLTPADYKLLLLLLAQDLPGLRLSPLEQRQLWGFVAALRNLELGQSDRGEKPVSSLVEDFPQVAAAVFEAAGAASDAIALSGACGRARGGLSVPADALLTTGSAMQLEAGGNLRPKEEKATRSGWGFEEEQAARLAGNALRSWALRGSTAATDGKRRSGEMGKEACLARARLGLLQVEPEADLPRSGSQAPPQQPSSPVVSSSLLSSEDLCWCVHADGEEAMLAEAVASARQAPGAQGKLLWPHIKKRGVGFWLRNPTQVKALADLLLKDATVLAAAETAAQQGPFGAQGGRNGDRGAGVASGLAFQTAEARGGAEDRPGGHSKASHPFLHQDSAALWSVASARLNFIKAAYKQQKNLKVVEFLSRDFSDPRSQAAAEKNAYKLVQQRRYHLALAFFILARQIREVCDLCCRQLQDVQLALFLCRLTDATQRPCGPPLGADSFSSASAFPPPTDASSRQSPSSLTSAGAGCAPPSPGSLPVACGTLCPSASPPPLSSPTLGAESPGGALSPSSVTSSPAAEYRRVLILRLAPLAAAAGDVWLLHLAFWLAGDHGAAFFVLLPPHLPPASFSRLAPLTQPHAQIATCCPTEGGRRANSRGCASPDHTWNWRSEHSDLSTLTPFDPRPFFFSPHSSRASCLSPSLSSLVSASGSARASLITHAEASLSRLQGAPTGFFSWAGTDASDTASLHEDADRFDGGALRHSALSLSLVAFRSVVQNALPIQRLRVQLEEQHTQLQLARELHAQLRAQSPLARALGSAVSVVCGPREDTGTGDGHSPGDDQSRTLSFGSLPSRGSLSNQPPFHFLHHSSASTLAGFSDTTRGDSEVGGGALGRRGESGWVDSAVDWGADGDSDREGRETGDTASAGTSRRRPGGSGGPEGEQRIAFGGEGSRDSPQLQSHSDATQGSAVGLGPLGAPSPRPPGDRERRAVPASPGTSAGSIEARGASGGATPTEPAGVGESSGAEASGVARGVELAESAVFGEAVLWALKNPAAAAMCELYLLTLAYLHRGEAFLAAVAATRFLALARRADLDERQEGEKSSGLSHAPGEEHAVSSRGETGLGRSCGDSGDFASTQVARGGPTAQAAFELLFASWAPCLTVNRSLPSSEAAMQIRLPLPESLFEVKAGESCPSPQLSATLAALTGLNAGTLLLLPESPFASLLSLPVASGVSEKVAPNCLHCGVSEAASSPQAVSLSLPDTVASCFVAFLDRMCGAAGCRLVLNKTLLASSSLSAAAARKSATAFPFSPHCPSCRPRIFANAEAASLAGLTEPSESPSAPSVAAPPMPSAGETGALSAPVSSAFHQNAQGTVPSPIRALGLLESIAAQLLLWSDRRRRMTLSPGVSGDRDPLALGACSCAERRLLQAIQAAGKLGGGRRLAAVAADAMAWAAGVGPVAAAMREQRLWHRLLRAPETAAGPGVPQGADGPSGSGAVSSPPSETRVFSSSTRDSPVLGWAEASALGGRLPTFFEEDTQHLASNCFLAALRAAALGRRAAAARRCERALGAGAATGGPSGLAVSRRGRKAAWRLARFCAAGWVRSEALLNLSWRREVRTLLQVPADEFGAARYAYAPGLRGGESSETPVVGERRTTRETFMRGALGVLAKELIATFDAPERQLFDSLALFCCTATAAAELDVSLSSEGSLPTSVQGGRHEGARSFVCGACTDLGEDPPSVSSALRPSSAVLSLEQLERLFHLAVVALACVSLCLSAAFPFLSLFFSLHPSTHTGAQLAPSAISDDLGLTPNSAPKQETGGAEDRPRASSTETATGELRPGLRPADEIKGAGLVSPPETSRPGASAETRLRARDGFGAPGGPHDPEALGEDAARDVRPFHPLRTVLHVAVYLHFILMQPERSTWRVELRRHLRDFLWPRLLLGSVAESSEQAAGDAGEEGRSGACEADRDRSARSRGPRAEGPRGGKANFFPASSSLLQCLATCLSVKVFEFLLDALRAVDREALRLLHFLQLLSLVASASAAAGDTEAEQEQSVGVNGEAAEAPSPRSSSTSAGRLSRSVSGLEADGFATAGCRISAHALRLQERQIDLLRGWIDRLCFSLSSFLCTHLRPLLTRAAPLAASLLLPLLCCTDPAGGGARTPEFDRSSFLGTSLGTATKSAKASLLCGSISELLGPEASQLWILLGCTNRLQWLFSQLPFLPLPQPAPPSAQPSSGLGAPPSGGAQGAPKNSAGLPAPAGPVGIPAGRGALQKLSAGVAERAARAAALPGSLAEARSSREGAGHRALGDGGSVGGFGARAGKKAGGESWSRLQLQEQLVRAGIPHLLLGDRPQAPQRQSGLGWPLSRLQQQLLAELPSLRVADELVVSGAFPGVPCVLGGLFPPGKICSIAASRSSVNALDALRKAYDHHLPSFLTPQAVALLLAEAAGMPCHHREDALRVSATSLSLSAPWWSSPCCAVPLCAVLGPVTAACSGTSHRRYFLPAGASMSTDLAIGVGPLEGLSAPGAAPRLASNYVLRTVRIPPSLLGASPSGGDTCTASLLYGAAAAVHATAAATAAVAATAEERSAHLVSRKQAASASPPERVVDLRTKNRASVPDAEAASKRQTSPRPLPPGSPVPSDPSAVQPESPPPQSRAQSAGPSDLEATGVGNRRSEGESRSSRRDRAEALRAEARWLLSLSAPLVSEAGGPGGAFVGIAPLRRATVNSSQHLQRRLGRVQGPPQLRRGVSGPKLSTHGCFDANFDSLLKTSGLLSASWSEGSVLLSVWFGYLLTRDTSLFAYAQVDRMSAAMRLLAAAAAADVSAPPEEGVGSRGGAAKPGGPSGASGAGKAVSTHPLSPTGADPPGSIGAAVAGHGFSAAPSLEPTFPYQAFPSLSVLRSRFSFTGAVGAHPFLPIFAAALQAVEVQSSPATAFAAILRPFGAHARSLPKGSPAALPATTRMDGPSGAESRDAGSSAVKADAAARHAGPRAGGECGDSDVARVAPSSGATQFRAAAESARAGAVGPGEKGARLTADSRSASFAGACGHPREDLDSETGKAAGSDERRQMPQALAVREEVAALSVSDRGEGSFSFDVGPPTETGKETGAKGRAGAPSPGATGARVGGSDSSALVPSTVGGATTRGHPQEVRLQSFGRITAVVWSESGDSLFLADSNGWVRVFGLLRGPLMPPSAAVAVAAAAADPDTAARLGISTHLPRHHHHHRKPSSGLKEGMLAAALQQVSRPTVAWRAHVSTAEVIPLFGCGSWLLTRGVGLFPHALRHDPVLVEGRPFSVGASLEPAGPRPCGTGGATSETGEPDPNFFYRRGRGREGAGRGDGRRSVSVGNNADGDGDDEDPALGFEESGALRSEWLPTHAKPPMRVSVQALNASVNSPDSGGLGAGRGGRAATPPGRMRASAVDDQLSAQPEAVPYSPRDDRGDSGDELRRRQRSRPDSDKRGGAKTGGHYHHPFSIFRRGRGKGCCEAAAAAAAGGGLGRMRSACLPARRRESVSVTTETEKDGAEDAPLGPKRRRSFRMLPNAARRFRGADVIAKIHSRLLQYQSQLQLRHGGSQFLSRRNSQRDGGLGAGKGRTQGGAEAKGPALFEHPVSGPLTRGRIGAEGLGLSGDCALYSEGDGPEEENADSGPLAAALPLQQWTSALFGFGGPEVSDDETSQSGKERVLDKTIKQMPQIAGPCICVWDLWDMTEGGGPRLDCVITCDDLLSRIQQHLAGVGGAPGPLGSRASKRGKKSKKQVHTSDDTRSRDTWEVVPTHTPTCMCVAVLQDGPALCGCCGAACSGGCGCAPVGVQRERDGGARNSERGTDARASRRHTVCAGGSSCRCCSWCCGSVRCVVYGDTDGSVHAVDLAAQEEVHRWRAHPSAVAACSVSRPAAACPSHSTVPGSWLITAAAASAADATFRCWSLSALAGGAPFLLYEFTSPGHIPLPLRDAGRAPRPPVTVAGSALFSSWRGELGPAPGVLVGDGGCSPEERRSVEHPGVWGEAERLGVPRQPPQSVSPFSPFAPSSANALVRLLGGDAKETKENTPAHAEESVSMLQVVSPGGILTVRHDGTALLNRL
ncbi:RAVE 1 carboxy-terminal protein [Toxoplasma gondii VEG]|uniref:RAVE 1 carboxy-terminal protein n=1 Tax=Toxoplasma gondii (strain ATCC 50861 / VEG) TaxID=432359 RepID=V4ZPY4_TOXGV|nr:RAVE 1 carboxy-terminal protein [Toxoplasma gondii VEG]CEL74741.1 TPA: hypothetical protein BN1205_025510 [Toxoplasma gondii VEG]